jgi:hypothetical protein
MSEGVELLIKADDQASKVLDNVAETVDQKVSRIKDVGGKAKASTEFIGTLANTLGGSQLGGYAQQLAGLTERVSAFSEVSKAGAGGAAAFAAGLGAVSVAVGLKVGMVIGDWVADTAEFTKQLQEANAELLKAADTAADIQSVALGISSAKIELIDDVDKKNAAYRELLTSLSKEAEEHAKSIELIKQQHAEEDKTIAGRARLLLHSEEIAEMRKAELAVDEKILAGLEKEQAAIGLKLRSDVEELRILKETSEQKKKNTDYIKSLGEEVALLKASKDQRAAIESLQKSGGDTQAAAEIESLLRERDALNEKKDAEKLIADEKKKEVDRQLADAKRIDDLKKSEIVRLTEQRIELEQGAEAARKYALEQKGLDSATAIKLASEEAAVEKLRKEKETKLEADQPQQGVQGRLLTRGDGEDTGKKQLAVQEKMVKELQQIRTKLPLSSSESITFEVVGRS